MDDVALGTSGLLIVVLTVALAQIGIPEISKETLDAMAAEIAVAKETRRAAERAAAREKAARAEKERELASERRRRKRAEAAEARAEQAMAQAETARKRAERAQAKAEKVAKNALEPKPCDVVITIDTTVSQADEIAALRSAALSLSEIGARLSPRFRIGVVAYNGEGFVSFPPTEIRASANGSSSEGMKKLQAYLDGLETVSGPADVEGGLKKAFEMLDGTSKPDFRQLMVLCGDAGPWEGGDLKVIEPADRASAKHCVDLVREFGQRNEQNRVLALFTGQRRNLWNKGETIDFFREVAKAAGERGTYSADVSQLSATLVEALFGN